MSKTNFAPGTVCKSDVNPTYVAFNDGITVSIGCANDKERDDYAALIAASPDLYDAVNDFMTEYFKHGTAIASVEQITKFSAALIKARGET